MTGLPDDIIEQKTDNVYCPRRLTDDDFPILVPNGVIIFD